MKIPVYPIFCYLCLVLLYFASDRLHSADASLVEGPAISEQSARLQIARMLMADERAAEAVREYRRLLQEDPGLHAARLELAGLLATMGENEEAARLLESVPKERLDRGGWETLASIYESQSQFSEAEKIYRDLLAREPDSAKTRFRLSMVLAWQKKYDDSLVYLGQLASERPDDIQLWRHYAQILGWAGRHSESIEAWKKSIADDPS
jgi:predicted Zn-dependent protease